MTSFRSWTSVLAAGMLLAFATGAAAQRTELELGTQAGFTFTRTPGSDHTHTLFVLPGGGLLGQPTIYLAIFPTRHLSIDPQMTFIHSSGGGGTDNVFAGSLRLAGYLQDAQASPYLFGDVALTAASEANSEFAPGIGIGYRAVVGRYIALRPEFEYRKWSDHGPHEFRLALSFGVVLPSGR